LGQASRHARTPNRSRSAAEYAVFALLACVPMLATQPGAVSDDTKTYLYLDPGRYIRQAVSLWDPNVALGTVTHENIGYLFPMGPFFWLCAEAHIPVWVAQRLWMACLLFAAGAGMLYLCRVVSLRGPGRYVAALAFMFTPYVLQYAGRISVILMPWSGLPWMLAFVILALRRPGWKYPALFALVVALVSGINASSIIYVVIGPALWLPFAVIVLREVTWRQVWAVVWRTGLLSALVSLWWAVGLQVEAAYGVNILKYTETLESTSSASSPIEAIRGLGYWFFYGSSNQTGNWQQAAVAYTQWLWLIGLSFLVPALAVAAGVFVRWRNRAFFILVAVVGMVLAVGPFPYNKPTGVGWFLRQFMQDTTVGLALRSTDRASPLIILGFSVLLGAGVTAAAHRFPTRAWAISGLAVGVIAASSAPLWATGDSVVSENTQPASPPSYVLAAAKALNATHPGTRVYALPGNNFAAYRWGDTNDTVYPALLTRPFVTHEQQTMGSLPTADLLEAIDTPMQEGTFDPRTLAPLASLMSAGDVLVQYDQAYERYNTPDPKQVELDLTPTPPGLSDPVSYGAPRPNISTVPELNAETLSQPPDEKWPAPLVSYTVDNPRPIVRAESTEAPLVIAGNSSGLAAASSVGLLSGNPTIFYAGTLDTNPTAKVSALSGHPDLVVTDTNAKQGYRWNGISENAGYIETAKSPNDAVFDPTNAPLKLFPGALKDAYSNTVFDGIKSITASSYGSPVQYDNDMRPAAAMDGSTQTAWQLSQYPIGQWWEVDFDKAHTIDSINLSQLITPRPTQVLTKVTLSFDYKHPITVDLTHASQTAAGQTIHFSPRTFSLLRISVQDSHRTKYQVPAGYENFSGLSEVRIPGVHADEAVSMPEDLLHMVGTSSQSDPLTFVMTRLRSSGYPPRGDYELNLSRVFTLPTTRTFNLAGQARLSPSASDQAIDEVLGRTGGADPVVSLASSSRLTGNVEDGAAAAIDGDPGTAWETAFGITNQAGASVQYELAAPLTFDRMNLQVLADGQHSVPTVLSVSAGGRTERVHLPAISDRRSAGSVTSVPIQLPEPLSGSTIRVTVDQARIETTVDFDTQAATALPIGIAELGIPGLVAPATKAALPGTCRDDLLTVDGSPVWVSVTGASSAALDRQPLTVSLCGPDVAGLRLGPGTHTLQSTEGSLSGLDIDQVALASAAGGGPAAVGPGGQLSAPDPAPAPAVTVVHETATGMTLHLSDISSSTSPFELVLGQSVNLGWKATTTSGQSLGSSNLVDGFANGWRVDPAALAGDLHGGQLIVLLRWTPQRGVDVALVVSAAALVACLAIVLVPVLRRRQRTRRTPDDEEELSSLSPSVPSSTDAVDVDVGQGGRQPVLVPSGGAASAHRVRWGITLPVVIVCGFAAGAIAAPLTGLAVAVGIALVLRRPRWRLALGTVAVVCVVATGIFIVVSQGVDPKPANGGWPNAFGTANAIVWVGMLFLGADAVVELVIRSQWRRRTPDGAASADVDRPDVEQSTELVG
jgi:arabinofuranan 3-O-arabinosyltransferase